MLSRIKTRTHVALFAFMVTVLMVAVVVMIVLSLYPPDLAPIVAVRAPITTILVTFPLVFVLGMKIRENHELVDALREMVDTDRLTGTSSRDRFFGEMSRREKEPGAVLMVDIDHFKSVNDRYGHLSGDAAIKAVSGILRHIARGSDLVCRFGGEEFIMFISRVDEAQAGDIAERLRTRVKERPLSLRGVEVSLTVSVGVAGRMSNEDLQETIRRADEGLYLAKNAGRDRVVIRWDTSTDARDGARTHSAPFAPPGTGQLDFAS